MALRTNILAQVDDYFDSLNSGLSTFSSCEAAIAGLQSIEGGLDEKGRFHLTILKQFVPLEYIQNEDHREAYLFKYHAKVSLMTFGFAAVNAEMLTQAKIDIVLMDDCNIVPELISMIALFSLNKFGSEPVRVVMCGDDRVEPVSDEHLLAEYNYGQSLFKRLRLLDCLPTVKLDKVFNVPPVFAHHFSNCTPGECIVDFIEVEIDDSQGIWSRRQNVLEAEELVDYYEREGLGKEREKCVVLSPFNAQCDLLADVFTDRGVTDPPLIVTVDKFSGAHAPIVLCSLAIPKLNGFLKERLPTIMTRATVKLILFKSPSINFEHEKF
jgi:hypothetical protein